MEAAIPLRNRAADVAGVDHASSRWRTAHILVNLTGAQIVNSFATGLLIVGIVQIARDISLDPSLVYWPQAIYSQVLTCACSLITFGAVSDIVGPKRVFLAGCTFLGLMNIACSRSQTGAQLIVFRACLGVGTAMCMPTAISIITKLMAATDRADMHLAKDAAHNCEHSKHVEKLKALRSFGLAMQGLGLPLGFSLGLLLGGFFTDSSLTWRFAFYLNAGLNALIVVHGIWALPADVDGTLSLRRLWTRLDIMGVVLSVLVLAPLLTALAFIAANPQSIRTAPVIVLICMSTVLAPLFPAWMWYGEKHGKHVLLPNSLWTNTAFTSICIMVFLSWAVVEALEVFLSLFYQNVQMLSAQQASLRYLPDVILGIVVNLLTGLGLGNVYAYPLTLAACAVSCTAPLIMALIDPSWPYWYAAFWAVLLSPVSNDVLFTVGAIIITSTMSEDRQAVGGAVFSTCAQLGVSLGLAVFAVIASAVTDAVSGRGQPAEEPMRLMVGFRAAFWAMFGCSLVSLLIGAAFLQDVAQLGVGKRRQRRRQSARFAKRNAIGFHQRDAE